MSNFKIFTSIILVSISVFFVSNIFAQNSQPTFVRDFSISVRDIDSSLLKYPWVGGLNTPHFNNLDLNFDGHKDLIVFDKHGNKKYTFLNDGISDSISFTYAPEYEKYLPPLTSWCNFVDYNMDGLEDIFSYWVGGMSVYRNTSTPGNISFYNETKYLLSYAYTGYTNIYVTNQDYPAIIDIDKDGDLDILTFFILGQFVEWNKNQSMELYGVPDSLDYKVVDRCWGNFNENDTSNELNLNVPCPFPSSKTNEPKHTGSTLLLKDIDNDNDFDLMLGDTDYQNIIKITNGGTASIANMVSQDTAFPSNTVSVDIPTLPVLTEFDINNNGIYDLIASSFESDYKKAKCDTSVWLYMNNGTNILPVYKLANKRFLQEDMIDLGAGAKPCFVDENGDGLLDIVVANYGTLDSLYYDWGLLKVKYYSSISLYRNIGSLSNPEFKLITTDFANIRALKLVDIHVCFYDIDADNDIDMFIGKENGAIVYFENISGVNTSMSFTTPVNNYLGIDVGYGARPTFYDIDNDSLTDLIIGRDRGLLSYYRNTGTAGNPTFTWLTDSLGHVNVTDFITTYNGLSSPAFCRDSIGRLHLYVGSYMGQVFHYTEIEANLPYGNFVLVDTMILDYDAGMRTNPAIADLNGDGNPELLVGNHLGGLAFFMGDSPSYVSVQEWENNLETNIFPNPTRDVLNVRISDNDNKKVSYQIYDISGKLILKESNIHTNQFCINTSVLKAGIYIIKVEAGRKSYSSKFSKKQ